MIIVSLLLILVAVLLLVLGLAGGSSALLIGSIVASLLTAVTLVIGARQAATRRTPTGAPGPRDDQPEYATAGATRVSTTAGFAPDAPTTRRGRRARGGGGPAAESAGAYEPAGAAASSRADAAPEARSGRTASPEPDVFPAGGADDPRTAPEEAAPAPGAEAADNSPENTRVAHSGSSSHEFPRNRDGGLHSAPADDSPLSEAPRVDDSAAYSDHSELSRENATNSDVWASSPSDSAASTPASASALPGAGPEGSRDTPFTGSRRAAGGAGPEGSDDTLVGDTSVGDAPVGDTSVGGPRGAAGAAAEPVPGVDDALDLAGPSGAHAAGAAADGSGAGRRRAKRGVFGRLRDDDRSERPPAAGTDEPAAAHAASSDHSLREEEALGGTNLTESDRLGNHDAGQRDVVAPDEEWPEAERTGHRAPDPDYDRAASAIGAARSSDEYAAPDPEDPDDEPLPQSVRPTDAVRVARMTTEVLVVDGRPRYHLQDCPHLAARTYEALPVAEAVELGFSPCGLCRPVDQLVTLPTHR